GRAVQAEGACARHDLRADDADARIDSLHGVDDGEMTLDMLRRAAREAVAVVRLVADMEPGHAVAALHVEVAHEIGGVRGRLRLHVDGDERLRANLTGELHKGVDVRWRDLAPTARPRRAHEGVVLRAVTGGPTQIRGLERLQIGEIRRL